MHLMDQEESGDPIFARGHDATMIVSSAFYIYLFVFAWYCIDIRLTRSTAILLPV
jgi:hypothetical protein